ncbi:GDP-mannose 4,6-dehydratase [Paracoccaceae bacterium]|nr:GDP-mannose 4,6-dehydratase [Paracoccaceae bacterium]
MHRPAALVHFAALSQVGESMQEPGLYWKNNVMGSLNLIQAAVDHGCLDFVFSSTCATYGDQDGVVLDENSSQYPINAYGASKRAVENILADYQAAFSIWARGMVFRCVKSLIRPNMSLTARCPSPMARAAVGIVPNWCRGRYAQRQNWGGRPIGLT